MNEIMNREELLKIAKPILFSTPMVRAIQENRKTATRRIIKTDIPEDAQFGYTMFTKDGTISCRGTFKELGYGEKFIKLPYKVGDILYVRETWSFLPCLDCDERCGGMSGDFYKSDRGCYVYRTNYGTTEDDTFPPSSFKWHPSIHMPKKAARIFLKVTDVRIERLQDITERDVIKEGFRDKFENDIFTSGGYQFAEFWCSTIKGKDIDIYGWDANPWVEVVEFEKIEVE